MVESVDGPERGELTGWVSLRSPCYQSVATGTPLAAPAPPEAFPQHYL
jgi:hypothetical protein